MGGRGKTQLARRFMFRVYRKHKGSPGLAFYVDATAAQIVKAGIVAIAKANGVGESSEAALAWMSNLDKAFFLYFDNADDHTVNLRDYFPNSKHARILVTTRFRDAQPHYGSGPDSAIHLGTLSEDEAVDPLRRSAGFEPDDSLEQQSAVKLLQELHCLPLAVVQAGAATFKSRWTVDEYLGSAINRKPV